MLRNLFPIFMMSATALIGLASTAEAGGRHPVYYAADDYRDAVVDFERAVFKARDMDRAERTLADELEDQTSRIRREARSLDDLPRLGREIDEALRLHQQIEAIVLSDPSRPSIVVLGQNWAIVNDSLGRVISEFQLLVGGSQAVVQPCPPTIIDTAPIYPSAFNLPAAATEHSGSTYYSGRYQPVYGQMSPVISPVRSNSYQRFPVYGSGHPAILPAPIAVPVQPIYRNRTIGNIQVGARLQR